MCILRKLWSDLVSVSFSALLLNSVMSAFRAEFIATRSMDFIGMIKECNESGFPKVGSCFTGCWEKRQWCLPDCSGVRCGGSAG